jgi:hypothetical protein
VAGSGRVLGTPKIESPSVRAGDRPAPLSVRLANIVHKCVTA